MGMIGINIDRLERHQNDYKPKSWESYTFQELGNIIAFFAKRASHRTNEEKKLKDLYDAKNYLAMMEAKLIAEAVYLNVMFEDL